MTATTSFKYYPHDYYFGLKDLGANDSKRNIDFVKINYLDESLEQSEAVNVQVLREDWDYIYRESRDGLYWHWQKELTEIKSFTLSPEDLAKGKITVDCPTGRCLYPACDRWKTEYCYALLSSVRQ